MVGTVHVGESGGNNQSMIFNSEFSPICINFHHMNQVNSPHY